MYFCFAIRDPEAILNVNFWALLKEWIYEELAIFEITNT